MIRILATSAIVICGVGLANSARSQDVRPGGPPVAMGPAVIGQGMVPVDKNLLLQLTPVQDDLALTSAQRSRIDEAVKQCQRDEQAANLQFQDHYRALGRRPTREAMKAITQQFQEELNAFGRRCEAEMLNVLDSRQRTRLDQIHLQADGPMAFSRPDVQKRLQLDSEQIRAIRAAIARGFEQRSQIRVVPDGVPPVTGPITFEQERALYESKAYQDTIRKNRKIAQNARITTLQAVTKILKKDQRAQYLAMLGEPFDFARLPGGKPAR